MFFFNDAATTEIYTLSLHDALPIYSGKVRYSPAPNYNGSDSFSYKVCDNGTTNGSPDSNWETALLSFTHNEVNYPPVAANDAATTDEDASSDVNVVVHDSTGPADKS